jgi:hypothetical protein
MVLAMLSIGPPWGKRAANIRARTGLCESTSYRGGIMHALLLYFIFKFKNIYRTFADLIVGITRGVIHLLIN